MRRAQRTRIISAKDARGLASAARAIREGGVVGFPTETVYGLGANAFDEKAVRKIFRVKGRPVDNPLIVHVASLRQAEELLQEVPKHFRPLAEAFWPGPLSIIGHKNASVPDIVTAGLPKVAIRMPDHPLARRLIRAAGVPLVAPSANRSGAPSPTSVEDVMEDLRGKISLVLNGGRCRIGIESTVIDVTGAQPVILRPGKVTALEISRIVKTPVLYARETHRRPASPGMKYVHYAPEAELVLFLGNVDRVYASLGRYIGRCRKSGIRTGLLAGTGFSSLEADEWFSLKRGGALEYARGMYEGMRWLDRENVDLILCPGVEPDGVGLAVMNRLRKAAGKIVRCR